MLSYGAENILKPYPLPFNDDEHIFHVADRIAKENPNHYFMN